MSKHPNTHFNDKPCHWCGTLFTPTAPSHHNCSDGCSSNTYRDKYLKRTYGISLVEYNSMLEEQDYKCKICLGDGFLMAGHHVMKLVVDHCHETGVVRGLLCHNCNRALGLFKDDADIVSRGVEYLKKGSETIRKEYAQVSGSAQPLERG